MGWKEEIFVSHLMLPLEATLIAAEFMIMMGVVSIRKKFRSGGRFTPADISKAERDVAESSERVQQLRRRLLRVTTDAPLPLEHYLDPVLTSDAGQGFGRFLALYSQWQTTRRVYEIDAAAFDRLLAMPSDDVRCGDIPWPMPSFAVLSEKPFTVRGGNAYRSAIFGANPLPSKGMGHMIVTMTGCDGREATEPLGDVRWRRAYCALVERGEFWRAVEETERVLTRTVNTDWFDIPKIAESYTVGELIRRVPLASRQNVGTYTRVLAGLAMALAEGKTAGVTLQDERPRHDRHGRPRPPGEPEETLCINDVANLSLVANEHVVDVTTAMERIRRRNVEPTGREVGYHTRRGYTRIVNGRVVEVGYVDGKPGIIEVRKDKKNAGELPAGTVSKVRV